MAVEKHHSPVTPKIVETGRELGRGAYGKVMEMKLEGGAIVAGKKIHECLCEFEPSNIERFQKECDK